MPETQIFFSIERGPDIVVLSRDEMGFIGSHILLPLAIYAALSVGLYRRQWPRAMLTMSAAFLLDLDHLAATPVFDPNRCSIGCHPLHTHQAIALYALLFCHPKPAPLGLGVLVHLCLDGLDCMMI